MKLLEFLQATREQMAVGLSSLGVNFMAPVGGVVGAVCVTAARPLASERIPASLDVRFIRGLTEGGARVVPTLVHGGRTLSVVSVDIVGSREKLCTRATVSLANADALESLDHADSSIVPNGLNPYDEGNPCSPVLSTSCCVRPVQVFAGR